MNIIKNRKKSKNIEGLEVIELDTFKDFRGEIWTVYSEEYSDLKFVADKITVSTFGVLRGFHGDKHTAKLITCLSGQMQFAVVDLRKESDTYGNVEQFFVSDNEPKIIFVPAGCVNAHLAYPTSVFFIISGRNNIKVRKDKLQYLGMIPILMLNGRYKTQFYQSEIKKAYRTKEFIFRRKNEYQIPFG